MVNKIAVIALTISVALVIAAIVVTTRGPQVEHTANVSCWDGRADGKAFLQIAAKSVERISPNVIIVTDPQMPGALPGTTIEIVVGSSMTCALATMPAVPAPIPAPAPAPKPVAPTDAGPAPVDASIPKR